MLLLTKQNNFFKIKEEKIYYLQERTKCGFGYGYCYYFDLFSREILENPLLSTSVLCIGYEHKITTKTIKEKNFGNKITHDLALNLFYSDIARVESFLLREIKKDLPENIFSALVFLVFDIGEKTFSGSKLKFLLCDSGISFEKNLDNIISELDKFVYWKGEKRKLFLERREIEKKIIKEEMKL